MPIDVGVRLRHARNLRGINQEQLAKAAGMPQSAISQIETGRSKSPSGGNLIAISRVLKISPEWLSHGRGPMDDNSLPALPQEALALAREWLKLGKEARQKVLELVRTMVRTSAADHPHASDERVAAAYGKPGAPKRAVRK
jgi:transcriptional regulator with XRE-family HTH domain